jgi:tRNA pseudouridine38-40 synthase
LRYKLTIAYDGSGFHGWQSQKPPNAPPLRTVQDVVREAVQRAVAMPVIVQGASRTDSGVHAIGQVAHFDADTRIPIERLAMAINSRLPDDVEVRHACTVADDFDAVSDAISKQYRYRLWLDPHRPLHLRHLFHHCHTPLDVDAMRDAAARLIGEHDFAAFAAAGHGRQTTVRSIFDCSVEAHPATDPLGAPQVHIVVSGSGFLYNMVRILAGTLVEVGRHHWTPDRIDHLLAHPDRQHAGPTLPPQGLCLEWIKHRPESLIPPASPSASPPDPAPASTLENG